MAEGDPSGTAAGAMLGQLRFNVVDEAVRLLDTAAEPWSIEMELSLPGRLDEDRLRRAVASALELHPMARARLLPARRSDRYYRWEIAPTADLDAVQALECGDDDALAEARRHLHGLSVPLVEAPPLRLRLAHCRDGDVLMLNVNHAAMDGIGALAVVRSIGRAYAGADDPQPDIPLTAARDVLGQLGTQDREARRRRLRSLAGKSRDLVDVPARLARENGADRAGYGFVHRSLTAEQTDALTAPDDSATVNDVLLAALNLTVAEWNAEHGARCRRIGVLMPVNLRPKEWRHEVATNFVLMARIVTTQRDRTDVRSAVDAVRSQTARLKAWGTGAALVELLQTSPRLPLWVKQSIAPLLWLTGNRLVDTAVLTNLGSVADALSFGPAGEPAALWFSAPARLPCGLSLGAVTVAGRLHLSFRYRHPLFDAAAANRFAERYLRELEQIAAELAGGTSPRERAIAEPSA